MDISFVVITNGAKPKELKLVLESIRHQKIKNYEIFVTGDVSKIEPDLSNKILNKEPHFFGGPEDWTFSEAKKAADTGNLAEMRNVGCKLAKYENIFLLDDDMILSSDFYENLLEYGNDFDILTSQVRLPDGTRFWDHCCYQDPKRGHILLEEDENAENLYMSGGMAWMMKKDVFKKEQWDSKKYDYYNMSNLNEYKEGKHNEDTDFARRCRESGFKIKHSHKTISYHADGSYTGVGRMVRRRRNNRTHEWVKNFDIYFPTETIAKYAALLFNDNYQAESADIIRKGLKYNRYDYSLTQAWARVEEVCGKSLSDAEWSDDGYYKYLKDIELYKTEEL